MNEARRVRVRSTNSLWRSGVESRETRWNSLREVGPVRGSRWMQVSRNDERTSSILAIPKLSQRRRLASSARNVRIEVEGGSSESASPITVFNIRLSTRCY
jgi:hypothetical protein